MVGQGAVRRACCEVGLRVGVMVRRVVLAVERAVVMVGCQETTVPKTWGGGRLVGGGEEGGVGMGSGKVD